VLRLGPLGESGLRALLERQARAALTYDEVGCTRGDNRPSGYTHDAYDRALGAGAFVRAVLGLRTWQAHLGAGIAVYPEDATIEPDTNVILGVHIGPIYAMAPCRIVYVIEEPDRFGFAYGTLPGHPESGEEAFIVERDPTDVAHFRITAFSRPVAPIARLLRPIARATQLRTTRRYLHALERFANYA
jgi:uncharacterized protein (UPF0548 family)